MGKKLISFKGNLFSKGNTIKCKDNIQKPIDNIKYLLSLYNMDFLFIRHALNYIELIDTVNHYRNRSNNSSNRLIKRTHYPVVFFNKSFFAPFIFDDIMRVIGNYLTSSRTFFDGSLSKNKYRDKLNENNTLFFIHHLRNYFQHQKIIPENMTISSELTNDLQTIAKLSWVIEKVGFIANIDLSNKYKDANRDRLKEVLPDEINVFDYINKHMSIVINTFFDLHESAGFSHKKTKEAIQYFLQYTNNERVGFKIELEDNNRVGARIDTFQNANNIPCPLAINEDELQFLDIIFNNRIFLPTEDINP